MQQTGEMLLGTRRQVRKDGLGFVFVLIVSISSAGSLVRAEPGPDEHSLFADCRFRRGFLLSYPDTSHGRSVEAVLRVGAQSGPPAWRLCQWGTRYSLAMATRVQEANGDVWYENAGKKVLVGGRDSISRDLVLDVRGSAEYGQAARRSGQSWPHLLVAQYAGVVRPLDELAEIRLALSLRLRHCLDRTPPDAYDPSLHAAQFQWFFIVKNVNPDSPDRDDFYWFGVPFFDSRYAIPPTYMAKDAGKDDATGKFIYTVAGEAVGVVPLKGGNWLALDVNLLPFIRSGVQEAVERGYFQDADLHHYAVVNMNLGWEIPGTVNAAMQIRNLTIRAIDRDTADESPSY
jgi:hypothetical protein